MALSFVVWYSMVCHGMVLYGTLFYPGTEKDECRVGISNDLLITGIPHHRSHRALELAKGLSGRTGSRAVITTSGHGSSWFLLVYRCTKHGVELKGGPWLWSSGSRPYRMIRKQRFSQIVGRQVVADYWGRVKPYFRMVFGFRWRRW